jgi:cyclin D3
MKQDRFLSRCRISKDQFQLVGAVCILISSKFRGTNPISGKTLIIYTDNSITDQEIKVSFPSIPLDVITANLIV